MDQQGVDGRRKLPVEIMADHLPGSARGIARVPSLFKPMFAGVHNVAKRIRERIACHAQNDELVAVDAAKGDESNPAKKAAKVALPQELDNQHVFACDSREAYEALIKTGCYSGLALRYDDLAELRVFANAIDCHEDEHDQGRFRIEGRRHYETQQGVRLGRAFYDRKELLECGLIKQICVNKQLSLLAEVYLVAAVAEPMVAMEWVFASSFSAFSASSAINQLSAMNADVVFAFNLSSNALDAVALECTTNRGNLAVTRGRVYARGCDVDALAPVRDDTLIIISRTPRFGGTTRVVRL